MIKIYHNPRCRKSREGLALLESKNIEFEVVKYLERPIDFDELKENVKAITPVPGGVGPMTINTLILNTLLAAQKLI